MRIIQNKPLSLKALFRTSGNSMGSMDLKTGVNLKEAFQKR
ncbi:hypothetical protein BACCOPRO_02650 [Phocaeicola coprophilus DSM 18228 = JCM 13818]|uniref:Uncharacterized protein n=1 Tax=Phocaeicola coprophilus DSM 18228 = JCM 13818 TaxID=547042 RepID=S0F9R6_9BACT|nr:hypothetical protein BACCOPRO_02650 [Phocaeicola coprophilus DSM 18228 = JCM 13818]